ncbi:MAG: hypothetical protein ACL7BU_08475 [Candidatus Phlomobacter fragariae]
MTVFTMIQKQDLSAAQEKLTALPTKSKSFKISHCIDDPEDKMHLNRI